MYLCQRLSAGCKGGDTFSFSLSFYFLPRLINVKCELRKLCLFRLFRFSPHSFPRSAVSPAPICFTNRHGRRWWYIRVHRDTHEVVHMMDVKKNCLVFILKQLRDKYLITHTHVVERTPALAMHTYSEREWSHAKNLQWLASPVRGPEERKCTGDWRGVGSLGSISIHKRQMNL